MSTTLLLIRHAQSAPDRALPEEEWPLSEAGRAQAGVLADVLSQFGVNSVVSSPYIRAVDTVRPFAEQHHLPIAIEPDLRERLLTANGLRVKQSFLPRCAVCMPISVLLIQMGKAAMPAAPVS
jgi:2,3-bisphosphoglycerate-dependent phosphoglycerate mutase